LPWPPGRLSIIIARWKLEVGDGAGYCVYAVIVRQRTAVLGTGDARLIVNRD
jgi:hypothetical protein